MKLGTLIIHHTRTLKIIIPKSHLATVAKDEKIQDNCVDHFCGPLWSTSNRKSSMWAALPVIYTDSIAECYLCGRCLWTLGGNELTFCMSKGEGYPPLISDIWSKYRTLSCQQGYPPKCLVTMGIFWNVHVLCFTLSSEGGEINFLWRNKSGFQNKYLKIDYDSLIVWSY